MWELLLHKEAKHLSREQHGVRIHGASNGRNWMICFVVPKPQAVATVYGQLRNPWIQVPTQFDTIYWWEWFLIELLVSLLWYCTAKLTNNSPERNEWVVILVLPRLFWKHSFEMYFWFLISLGESSISTASLEAIWVQIWCFRTSQIHMTVEWMHSRKTV